MNSFKDMKADPNQVTAAAEATGNGWPHFGTRCAAAGQAGKAKLAMTVAAAAILVAGCGHKSEPRHVASQELKPAAVRVQRVEIRKVQALEEVVGTVRPKLRATVEAKASGRITELPVILGQKVKPGDLLVKLDAPEIKARLEQAEAGLEQAEREWNRISGLRKDNAATQADYDNANARYLVAKGAAAEARAMLSYIEVHAPFEGVVTRKWADVGDLATPGKPLVDLEDPARLQLEADVPEAIADKVQNGATMNLRLGEDTQELSSTVAEIAPIADPVSRTLRVKLDLPASRGLISGRFARLLVPLGETTSLRVPAAAVVQRGQLELVFVATNQQARLHLVKTGRRSGDEIEILSGLDHGDVVVTENATQLLDGQPLEVK